MRFISLLLLSLVALVATPQLQRSGPLEVPSWGVSSLSLGPATALYEASKPLKGVKWQGPFKVQVLEVKDADTVEVLFKEGPCSEGGLGAPCPGSILALRVRGIDTPEKKLCQIKGNQSCAACPDEAKLGLAATRTAQALLVGKLVAQVSDLGKDPYFGRIVGTITILHEGKLQNYSTLMIEAGLANRYDPLADGTYKKTKNWCPDTSRKKAE
jgi:endonuclease YncB( thermonuclease family)